MKQLAWPRVVLGFVMVFCAQHRLMANVQQVPVIRQVGAIPVQWQGEISPVSSLAQVQDLINSGFSQLVRDSKRFQVLNDEIIRGHWDSTDGRAVLRQEFELDAMVALSIQVSDDVHVWSLRLLSPSMDTYLIESDRVPSSWLIQATDEDITARLRELTYRLLNRYPIDVFVTSVQGRFITLSAGREQNIYEGQSLRFHRFRIASVHPANNSWLSYDNSLLGEARIIDTQSHSSVAQLTSLSHEGAIRVGDGARVEHIASRQLFARLVEEDIKSQRTASSSALIGPKELIKAPPKSEVPKKPKAPALAKKPEQSPPPQKERKPTEEHLAEIHEELVPPLTQREHKPFLPDWFSNYLHDFRVMLGLENWRYRQQTVNARSNIPPWLINRGEAQARLKWAEDQYSELSGGFSFGPTGSGEYLGFGLGMNWIQQIPAMGMLTPSMDGIEVGLQSKFRSLSVSGESFGGLDALDLGALARIHGQHHMIDMAQTIEYRLGLDLYILSLGQAGLAGLKKSINGMMAYGISGEAILKRRSEAWNLGAFFQARSGGYDNELGVMSFNSVNLGVMLRREI